MTLEATFSLTPRDSFFQGDKDTYAQIRRVQGVNFLGKEYTSHRYSFDHQHAEDELLFHAVTAVDPSVDYTAYGNRRAVPFVHLFCTLASFGTHKELALIFGFDAISESRLLIFSYAEQLGDEVLNVGDNQFLIVSESLESDLDLFFIHARRDGASTGGSWLFQGFTGYVV